MPPLDDAKRAGLLRALLDSFTDARALSAALWLRTGLKLQEEVDLRGATKPVFTEVLQRAVNQGWLEALIRAALEDAPQSQPMKDMAAALGLAPLPPPPPSLPLLAATSPVLQRLIRQRAPPVVLADFATRLVEASRAVCWIGLGRTGRPNAETQFGTGFLVGPDLLLTNHHVISPLLEQQVERSAVCCWFDKLGAGAAGAEVELAEAWCLAASPPAAIELGTGGTGPTIAAMDFALVRLAEPVGSAEAPGGGQRGWLRLAAEPPPFETRDFVIVLQHPAEIADSEEGAQRIALGTVLGFDAEGLRLRHDAGTTAGSSGSPCFTFDLRCAAMHQGGMAVGNQALPLRRIAKQLRERTGLSID